MAYWQEGLISIICPTRQRPENVLRLVESVIGHASNKELIEFLFYVDYDDDTFPEQLANLKYVRVFRGPSMWISNIHNHLFVQARGEILFSAGDDMIFKTDQWDDIVKSEFSKLPDRIALIYGNDLGSHAGKIATHGFFHRYWVEALGTWVQPGRGSLWDLWATENARLLSRLVYLDTLVIEHRHYRQSALGASFDSTYERIMKSNSAFRPELTYAELSRERRIDRLLLSEVMLGAPPVEPNFFLSELLARFLINKIPKQGILRLRTLTNLQLLLRLPFFVFRILATKYKALQ